MSDAESPTPQTTEKTEDEVSIKELVEAIGPLMPHFTEMQSKAAKHVTIQVTLMWAGGALVLALAFVAAFKEQWALAEKIAIPVLSFFGGLLAGRGKG